MNFSARIASIAAFSLLTATSVEAVPAGTLYEAFPTQLFSLDLGALTETGVISARATHLVAAGDHVFWQDDIRIWRANKDLSGVTNIWTNLRAPADISVDPTGTYLFEAFPTQLFTLDLRTLTETAETSAHATHLTAAGGYIFWQDDIRVWRAKSDLTEITNVWTNLRAPTDITVDPTGRYLYEAFATQLFTLRPRHPQRNRRHQCACRQPDSHRRPHLLAGRHPHLARQERPDRHHQHLDQFARADQHRRRCPSHDDGGPRDAYAAAACRRASGLRSAPSGI